MITSLLSKHFPLPDSAVLPLRAQCHAHHNSLRVLSLRGAFSIAKKLRLLKTPKPTSQTHPRRKATKSETKTERNISSRPRSTVDSSPSPTPAQSAQHTTTRRAHSRREERFDAACEVRNGGRSEREAPPGFGFAPSPRFHTWQYGASLADDAHMQTAKEETEIERLYELTLPRESFQSATIPRSDASPPFQSNGVHSLSEWTRRPQRHEPSRAASSSSQRETRE